MKIRTQRFLAYTLVWYDDEQQAKDIGRKLNLKNLNTGRDQLHDVECDGMQLYAVRV